MDVPTEAGIMKLNDICLDSPALCPKKVCNLVARHQSSTSSPHSIHGCSDQIIREAYYFGGLQQQ